MVIIAIKELVDVETQSTMGRNQPIEVMNLGMLHSVHLVVCHDYSLISKKTKGLEVSRVIDGASRSVLLVHAQMLTAAIFFSPNWKSLILPVQTA